ncbi:acyltransferase [Paucibacter sp. DJ2R-2]|uniref:acyltransferase n=1 Tax=Paucibacter sp. DJ2R-2 TaxID=2893558 RepID=UPI0021E468C6|nr:acyltransferase [Paucibacter sp. DJ2R-2]MCV2423102.1 acyltransferase [Paucibacter sp. DJ4R-1]MCV2440998.1 acyltransferase [Paucibacter sp. DJ2R-2]
MLSQLSSKRIDALRFPLIVGVVLIHASGATTALPPAGDKPLWAFELAKFIIHLLSHEFARTAVPLFFAISGYLFFLNFSGTTIQYLSKLKARSRSLLIPFLIWNLLTLGLFWGAELLPYTARFFSGGNKPISDYGVREFFSALLGIGRPPAAYQFWFVRDLIFIVVLTPIIRLLLKNGGVAYLTVLLLAWIVLPDSALPVSIGGLFFFSAGAFIAAAGRDFFVLDRFGGPIVGIAYLLLCSALAFIQNADLESPAHKIGILIGVVCIMRFSRFASSHTLLERVFIALGSSSFFVFAMHEPLLTLVRKLCTPLVTGHSMGVLLVYFLSVLVTLLVCLSAHTFLKSHAKGLEGILSGR